MQDHRVPRRTYLRRVLVVAAFLALFELLVGVLGGDLTGLRLAALISFGVLVLGYEAYRRIAKA